jgi:hypothetical protein
MSWNCKCKSVTGGLARLVLAGLCGLGSVTLVRAAGAAEQSEHTTRSAGKMSKERGRRLVGTIESIDRNTRQVVFAGENGQKETFTVPSGFKGFDKLKLGDKVDVTYTESVAVSLGKPGEKAGIETRERRSQEPSGERGAMQEVQATAEVLAVDPGKHELTVKGPEGNTRTISVEDPGLRQKMATMKPGDTIQIVYTEAIAGSITPARAK